MNEFLSSLSLFSKPNLDFNDDYFVITEDGSNGKSLKYWYSDPSVVTSPTKEVTMPSTEIEFNLSSDTLSEVTKAAAVIGVPDMVLESGELRVTDKKNDTSNTYSVEVGETDQEYCYCFKIENLKLFAGDYDVEITSKGISKFSHTSLNLQYFIATESDSTFGG